MRMKNAIEVVNKLEGESGLFEKDFLLSTINQYSALINLIKKKYNFSRYTFWDDVLMIDFQEFSSQIGVGEKKVVLLKKLHSRILENPEFFRIKNTSSLSASDDRKKDFIQNIPDKYKSLYFFLRDIYGVKFIQTYLDVLNVDLEGFALKKGVGKSRVTNLKNWKLEILEFLILDPDVFSYLKKQSSDYRLGTFNLSISEKKLLKKYMKQGWGWDDLTPLFILQENIRVDLKLRNAGEKTLEALAFLQEKIFIDLQVKESKQLLVLMKFEEELLFKDLGKVVLEDVLNFYSHLDFNDSLVFVHRLGYKEEPISSIALARKCKLSPWQIREIEKDLKSCFKRGMRVSQFRLKKLLYSANREELKNLLITLSSVFYSEKKVVEFLSFLSGVNFIKLNDFIFPKIMPSKDGLKKHLGFDKLPYPAKIKDMLIMLQNEPGIKNLLIAQAYLLQLKRKGFVKIEGDYVVPQNMEKEMAIIHILLAYPKGLKWREIISKVNEANLCRTPLFLEYKNIILKRSPWIYEFKEGVYKHILF